MTNNTPPQGLDELEMYRRKEMSSQPEPGQDELEKAGKELSDKIMPKKTKSNQTKQFNNKTDYQQRLINFNNEVITRSEKFRINYQEKEEAS